MDGEEKRYYASPNHIALILLPLYLRVIHYHRWERLFVFGILVIAGSACMPLLLSWPVLDPEPSYQGKTLSAWLRQDRAGSLFRPSIEENRTEFKNAIRQIGTNAIPYLLKMAA